MALGLICIEGNIGSGKTTLARAIAEKQQWDFIGEEFDENPFLPLFYKNADGYAFALEFSFLLDRVRQLKRSIESGKNYVSDYYVKKCLWFASLNLSALQFQEFERLFPAAASVSPEPELLVFLHLPVELLAQNIQRRGREYEQAISQDYLANINKKYLLESKKQHGFPVLNVTLPSNSSEVYEKVSDAVINFIHLPVVSRNQHSEILIS